jgi:hypothetical protein
MHTEWKTGHTFFDRWFAWWGWQFGRTLILPDEGKVQKGQSTAACFHPGGTIATSSKVG